MLPVNRPKASIAEIPAVWNKINAQAIDPVMNRALQSPVSIFVRSDIGPKAKDPRAIAAIAAGKAGCPKTMPIAAPSNAMCISAKRMVVRFKVTITTPRSEKAAPTTADAMAALWNMG